MRQLAVLVGLVAVVGACGDGPTSTTPGLKLEILYAKPNPEVIIYLSEPALNTLSTARPKRRVVIECFDGDGELLVDESHRWPFSDTDGGTVAPHVHVRGDASIRQIAECRLVGTKGPLTGRADFAR